MNYRATLEAERDELLELLPHARQDERARGAQRLREIVDELDSLNAGRNWTQAPGDTLGNIVAADIRAARKVLK